MFSIDRKQTTKITDDVSVMLCFLFQPKSIFYHSITIIHRSENYRGRRLITIYVGTYYYYYFYYSPSHNTLIKLQL